MRNLSEMMKSDVYNFNIVDDLLSDTSTGHGLWLNDNQALDCNEIIDKAEPTKNHNMPSHIT